MSAANAQERVLIEAAQREGLLPAEASAVWRDAAGPSWIVTALSFLGAQLVVLPFLVFLGQLAFGVFFKPPGAFITGAALIVAATLLLRATPGMFVAQLSFSALLAGLALLVVGFKAELNNPVLLTMLAVLLGVAWVVRVGWVQRVLGFLAAIVAMAVVLWPVKRRHGADILMDLGERFSAFPMAINAALLALLWAGWAASERRWSGRAWASTQHAVADGLGVALLLAVIGGSTRHFWAISSLWLGGAQGSADSPTAGLARIFTLGWPAGLQMALVVASAAWLFVHWRLREAASPRGLALMALVYAILLLACLVIPHLGVVALVGTVALGTGRRLMLGLALAALLAQLSGFYYALAWPLAHKAALLAGIGGALALVLWALRDRAAAGVLPSEPSLDAGKRWFAPVLIASGAALALGTVHVDVQDKEQVIAHGEKIYVPLVPRDPRSILQGDYMALNFDLPAEVRKALEEGGDALGLQRRAEVVATLDGRGVARVLRLARPGEALASAERRLPVQRLKHDWTLVTDAFYFPEGQGGPFSRARFGEFRVLPDGRALLVGLADDQLNRIQAGPRVRKQESP